MPAAHELNARLAAEAEARGDALTAAVRWCLAAEALCARVGSMGSQRHPAPIDGMLRLVPYRRHPRWHGPDRGEDCPCGSGRRARSCHSNRLGDWLAPEPPPLLGGDPTGFSHPDCYAAPLGDCVPKITKEHWLSKNIIEALYGDGLPPLVSGIPWLQGDERAIGANSLAAPVLCERHNSSLSPLDTAAGEAFDVLWDFQRAQRDPARIDLNEFALVNGPHIERFLLKLLWGGCAAGSYGSGGAPIQGIRSAVDQRMLLEALYRGGALPEGWGMFASPHEPDPHGPQHAVGIQTLSGTDGAAWGINVNVGAIQLSFALGVPGQESIHRPQSVVLNGPSAAGEKVLGFAWPSEGHAPLVYTYLGEAT